MLKGKKALVTGSSRGIGRKIVETFLANGAEVWGLCSKPSAAKPELEAFAKENGTVFHEICANVGDSEVLSEVVKAALADENGRLAERSERKSYRNFCCYADCF